MNGAVRPQILLPACAGEPEIARWVPAPNFRNKFREIRKLNDMIIESNMRDNLRCVRMGFQGVKRFKSGTMQHIFDTKPGSTPVWREGEVFRKLHFVMEKKLKIASHISTCFRENSERIKGHN